MTPQESFLKKAIAKHGDTYDYSQTFYVASHENVNIICKKHGVFPQKAYSHIAGKGCKNCARESIANLSRKSTATFISDAIAIHGNKYSYEKTIYVSNKKKVIITCSKHGDFKNTPNAHLRGTGCDQCGHDSAAVKLRSNTEEFIKKAKKIHGDKFDYFSVIYTGNKENVDIVCHKHGAFPQTPSNHLSGQGCPDCYKEILPTIKLKSTEEFIAEAKATHGDRYDYSLSKYTGSDKNITIICSVHGKFSQSAESHTSGSGCSKCSYKTRGLKYRSNTSDFVRKATDVHDGFYSYINVDYVKNSHPVTITCPIHGDFNQLPADHLGGHGCDVCANTTENISKGEQELCDYVSSIAPCIYSDRSLIKPLEIDCLVPSKKLGIEFCGVYYHSDKYKDNTYHLDKLKLTEAQDFGLIQIFDDEWNTKKDIVKSIIANRLGVVENTVYARKTRISYVERKDSEIFLNDNHIQGYVSAPIRIGLFYDDVLVMLATFSNKRESVNKLDENWYELVRLCAKKQTSIAGGFSKLMSFFIKNHHPSGIKTFCDKRYFNGNGYEKVGFVKSHETTPSYYYVKSGARYSRYLFQKHKLSGILKNYDPSLSERENMILHNYHRIYDCGLIVYKYYCG